MGIVVLPVTTTSEEIDMFGGLAAGFAQMVKPNPNVQGQAKDKRARRI
jgi:hypothetical protein